MKAGVLVIRNPFDPLGSRAGVTLRRPLRIRRLVRTLAPGPAPVIAVLNGRPLLRAGWRRRLRDGDRLALVVLPRGGGQGGSNPLRLILSLAVMAFAGWAAGALLGASANTVLFGTMTYGKAATLGFTMAGMALVNALLPIPKPGQLPTPSPTYSLQAQGNSARIEQPIPVQYGRVLSWPDFAAQPYAEFANDDQYLYQLLCLGTGAYDIEQILIEDTPITAFSEVQTEIIPPGGQVTLFPTSVVSSVEVSGQELTGSRPATFVWAATTITVTEVDHGRATGQAIHIATAGNTAPTGVYQIGAVTDADTYTLTAASGSGSGDLTVYALQGGLTGFIVSAAGTVAHRLAVDIVLPLGLYLTSDKGKIFNATVEFLIEARRVDDAGAPVGAGIWTVLAAEFLTDRTNTPIRRTYVYALPLPGRYAVRARRLDQKTDLSNAGHEVLFAGLRAYLREPEDFGPVTLIAIRMRATNNLSLQASRKIGVIATRKLPVWTGTAWTAPQATRSIAWALADAARDTDYGARLPVGRIDLDALVALDAVWAARGDTFDARFETAASWWDAASRIAAAGRARLFMQGGILRVVRDGPTALPVAMYSMRNITRGSFGIDYLMPSDDTADAIEVSYFDEATWTPQRVRAQLPGSTAARPVKMELFGVGNRAQALREGMYHAAANRFRRRIVRFSTEMEGFIPSIGDTIAVQHDMPAWGQHAEAIAWDGPARTLTLSEHVTFGAGAHYIGLRTRTGGISGPWAVTPGNAPGTVILTETPDPPPATGGNGERTHVVFGTAQTWRVLAKVLSVRPRGLYEAEIECVPDDPSVHTADLGVIAPPVRLSDLPRRITRPAVTGLLARRLPDDATRTVIAWTPAPGAEVYQIEMAEGDDVTDPTVSWTRQVDTTAAHHSITLLYAARTMIRVRGVGLAAGPWAAATLGALIEDMWNTDPTPMWTLDANAMWSVP
ncbi:MAG: host specificity factor TipJ family phage tail protein [Gemmobacter sp.]|nr:host specificity factor TipJ family phage tail protein [Gemmobacter sp.]